MNLEIEDRIIVMAMNGDVLCFEKLVTVYEKPVYNICLRYFNNEEDAKDASQEVFIKIFKNLKRYNFSCRFSTWAYKIAVNTCIDGLRKKKSRLQTVDIDESLETFADTMARSPIDSVITKESLKSIEKIINSLPVEHKTFIVLRDVNGLSYQDIATITDTNLGTVKSKISRARQFLRHRLISNGEEVV